VQRLLVLIVVLDAAMLTAWQTHCACNEHLNIKFFFNESGVQSRPCTLAFRLR